MPVNDHAALTFLLTSSAFVISVYCWWQCRKDANAAAGVTEEDRRRLRQLLAEGRLLHPQPSLAGSTSRPKGTSQAVSFADLSQALALCCGIQVPSCASRDQRPAQVLAQEIGGVARRHVVLVLCDGLGCALLNKYLEKDSFLRQRNDEGRLLAVFPSTTPAALCTLATAAWPGRHGAPGWDLRDQKGMEMPGTCAPMTQLRVLDSVVRDLRSSRPAAELGYTTEDVFVEPAWASVGESQRRMRFISAYAGTDFTDWYSGPHSGCMEAIPETAYETLGKPEGSAQAVSFFAQGVDEVLESLKEAEDEGWSSYIYLYTAHPDKHMHKLGVEHEEVCRIICGLDKELKRLWTGIEAQRIDAAMVVTADHGHLTVQPEDMVTLPDEVIRCLEYANLGVHGQGRHCVLHVRRGRRAELERAWAKSERLRRDFLLLDVDAAAEEGLFGPEAPRPEVRPRLGDLLAISIGNATLVKPAEAEFWRDSQETRGPQGGHGSLLPEEMRVPFVLCRTDDKQN